jgi:hypothetical protein
VPARKSPSHGKGVCHPPRSKIAPSFAVTGHSEATFKEAAEFIHFYGYRAIHQLGLKSGSMMSRAT